MRSCYRLAALVLLGAVLAHPGPAVAGVPDPNNSTVPQCLTACPDGDMPFTIVVRDLNSTPLGGVNVVLDFTACPDFTVCALKPTDPYLWNPATRQVSAGTNAAGSVTFPIRAGNLCDTAHGVLVFASGVMLAGRTMASPDQNGDQLVDGVDDAIVTGKVGLPDPTADFDCDGTVTLADVGVVQAHFHHACIEPTKAESRSWGGVKIIYR